jgi:hypothetical protein
MHRSGTSFLVRSLALSGLWLGMDSELQTVDGRAFSGNPRGNYESREVAAINEAILRDSMGTWHKPPASIVASRHNQARMQRFLSRLEAGKPLQFSAWGWKDPRTVLTLGCWEKILGDKPLLVATFRHPCLVARSLSARDGFPLKKGYALWAHYNRLLLRHLDGNPGVLLRFDVEPVALLRQVEQACRFLGLRADIAAIQGWFDQRLVRHTLDTGTVPVEFPAVAEVWEKILVYYRNQPPGVQE